MGVTLFYLGGASVLTGPMRRVLSNSCLGNVRAVVGGSLRARHRVTTLMCNISIRSTQRVPLGGCVRNYVGKRRSRSVGRCTRAGGRFSAMLRRIVRYVSGTLVSGVVRYLRGLAQGDSIVLHM